MKLLEQKPNLIADETLKKLIDELHAATNVHPESYQMLWLFLVQCLYPFGSDKRYKLEKNDLNPTGFLIQKVGKFKDTLIFDLCSEIAVKRSESAELYLNTSLYSFFNKTLPNFSKKKKLYKFHPRDLNQFFDNNG